MKIAIVAVPVAIILVAAAVLLPVAARAASGHDFDDVVSAVEQRYSAHATRVPMMGLVSFCAHVATGGGVKGLKVAELDHLSAAPNPAQLEQLVTGSLGAGWQPFVKEVSRNGEMNVIYAQPDGSAMRMMIADYEHGELDLVRVEVNGERLAHWVRDPESSAKHHDYGSGNPGTPD